MACVVFFGTLFPSYRLLVILPRVVRLFASKINDEECLFGGSVALTRTMRPSLVSPPIVSKVRFTNHASAASMSKSSWRTDRMDVAIFEAAGFE